jgi:hypothetical protein
MRGAPTGCGMAGVPIVGGSTAVPGSWARRGQQADPDQGKRHGAASSLTAWHGSSNQFSPNPIGIA